MPSAARLLAAWVAVTLVTVSTAARAQHAELTAAEHSQIRQLELRLDDVKGERAAASTLLPWAVLAIGVTSVVLGTAIGVGSVASCDDESCSSPFWPTWMVVGGAAVSTASVIWLKLVSEDIAELESRRYQLQMQLDAYETLREARTERAVLQLRGTF
jgi:hypothetical protein